MPARVVKVLEDETIKALRWPDVREQIERQGLEVSVKGPKQFAARISEETAMWAKVIEVAAIKAD
jgi:tripartite-type tricarboxylate transporter receptor subunit TctC